MGKSQVPRGCKKKEICKCGHARRNHVNSMFKNPSVCMICNCRKYEELFQLTGKSGVKHGN